MSTLTPLHRTTPKQTATPSTPHDIPAVVRWGYHVVQAAWLLAMVVTAIGAGHTLGFVALWLVGAGIIATLDFGYRELVLHDHPSSSL